MRETRMFLPGWRWATLVALLLLVPLVLLACGEPTAAPTKPPASEAVPTEVAAAPPTPTTLCGCGKLSRR